MKKKKKTTTRVVPLILYSDIYCDEFTIKKEHYDEFVEEFKNSQFFDETKINDLLYFAEEMFHKSSCDTTKQRLRLKIADLTDIIMPDELIYLKHFELKKLLNAPKENYYAIFNNLLPSDNIDENESPISKQ